MVWVLAVGAKFAFRDNHQNEICVTSRGLAMPWRIIESWQTGQEIPQIDVLL